METQSFLACYDYGQGGLWLLLEAESYALAQATYPELVVFEARPDWMDANKEAEYRASAERTGFKWNVHQPPSGWLAELIEKERQGK